VAKKKYDPLWEIVDEKVALQGAEPDVDAQCPSCHVTVHLGLGAKAGERYECGLCGGVSQVTAEQAGVALKLLG
jgi:ribosomal protein S27AE